MEFQKKTKLPIPRCPMCYVIMEEAQLRYAEDPRNPPRNCWMETWICKSCGTGHTFPARIEFLQYVAGTEILPASHKNVVLPD